jgi:glycosyltransferase involved in cell wall biosynthesis
MKILFFSDHFRPEPSAPAAHVYERARLWVRAGHQVTVLTAAPNFPEGRVYQGYRNAWRSVEDMDGIRVVRVKTFITRNEGFALRILDYVSYMLSAFLFAWREPRPDVVISTSPHLFVPMAGVAFSLLRRVPHVFELRDLWPATIAATSTMQPGRVMRMLEKLELWLYRRSARVLAFTQSFREDLVRRGIPAGKIDVVLNGANLEMFQPVTGRDAQLAAQYRLEGRFVVGYLGTLGLSQGLDNVIEAAALLRDSTVTFLFVGVGAAKEGLEDQTRRLGLDNVVFVPRQPKEAMPRFWSICDLSLIHLRNDPVFATVIPSKIFESMAVGVPVVYCGPAGDGSRIVEERRTGLLVEPAAPRALAAAVEQLRNDSELRSEFAANSVRAAPDFSRTKQADACLDVLQRAIAGTRS